MPQKDEYVLRPTVCFFAGAALFLQGCSGSQGTVKALRYEVAVCDSVCDEMHGWYHFIREVYFPDRNVVCNIVRWHPTAGESKETYEMHAFFSKIRNPSKVGPVETREIQMPTEEILVPNDLARKIFALAELNKRMEEVSANLGMQVFDAKILDGETRSVGMGLVVPALPFPDNE
jgi:hypothetical protein